MIQPQLTPIEKITKAKIRLLSENPFFGYLALNLRIKEDNNMMMPTACVDAFGNLFYDSNFINTLDFDETKGLIAHEIMHCFKGCSIIAGEQFKEISNIHIGDRILNSDGDLDTVKAISKRDYKGDFFKIKANNLLPFEVTSEHPFLTIKRKKGYGGNVKFENEFRWVKANELKEGDYLAIPKIKGKIDIKEINLTKYIMLQYNGWKYEKSNRAIIKSFPLNCDTAYLLGLYVADGSRGSKKNGWLSFSLDAIKDIEVATKIININNKYFRYKYSKRDNGKGCISVIITSTILSRAFVEWCGSGAKNKKIPNFILYNKDINILKSFILGYIDGDGHKNKRGVYSCATASKILVLGLQLALIRLGFLPYVQNFLLKERTIEHRTLKEGMLFSISWNSINKDRIVKLKSGFVRCNNRMWKDLGKFIVTPIKKIKKSYEECDVYNFETESNTYTANNVVVHNCALQHLSRLGGRDRDIANLSMDVVVQNLLQKSGFKLIKGSIIPFNDEWIEPTFNIHIKNISKKNYEMIYDELKPLVKQKQKLRELLKKVLDGHNFSKEEKQLTPAEKQMVKRWKELLVEATEIAKQKGDIPAGIERYVQILLEQKLDWRSLLYKYITRELPIDYNFRVPSKRSIASGYFVPSVTRENIEIVVSVDTSGSVGNNELSEFLTEIVGIFRSFDAIKAKVIVCDAKVHEVYDVENGSVDEILNLKMKGGGGTSHRPVLEYIEEELPKTKLWIAFTDGFSDIQGLNEPSFNVIWAISKNGVKNTFQFGETVFLEE